MLFPYYCFGQDIVICGIKLTSLTSFDFDYNGAVAPRAIALIPFLSQMWRLFEVGANLSKYGHAFNLICLKSLRGTWQENLKPRQ